MTDNDTLILTDEQADAAIASIQLPTFVYGTLRPDCGNDRIWRDVAFASFDGKCKVLGYRLVTNGGFPYALPTITEQTFGCLITPLPEHYDECMERMDALEGVPTHYTRETTAVLTPNGALMAYIYIATDPAQHAGLDEVWQNDWIGHLHRQRSLRTANQRWSSDW